MLNTQFFNTFYSFKICIWTLSMITSMNAHIDITKLPGSCGRGQLVEVANMVTKMCFKSISVDSITKKKLLKV